MLITALRGGLATVRRAGATGIGIALLSFAPLLVSAVAFPPIAVLGLIARNDVVLGLIRHLGAHRPEPLPPLPEVDEAGRRVARPRHAVAPAGPDDAKARVALRAAGMLLRPAVRVTALHLLVVIVAPVLLFLLSGGRMDELPEEQQVLLLLPIVALGATFFSLAGQRIALEGDPRVLLAAAHSLRIARVAYGPLLLLNLLQPALLAIAVLTIDPSHPGGSAYATAAALFVASVTFQLVGTATANEIYLAGPRLDLPAELGAPPTG